MTSFQGYMADPDNVHDWVESNTMSIETTEGVAADQLSPVPLVLVDTNYKPGPTGQHPVRLTIEDTLRATATLLSTGRDSLDQNSYAEQPAHDVPALMGLLKRLTEVDEAVWELRTWLQHEIEHQLNPDQDDEDESGDAEGAAAEVVYWRESSTSEHRNDGLYPFVFRQGDAGLLMLHSVAADTEHDHVTSDEPRTFLTASKQYGPLVRCDEHGNPLAQGQTDADGTEAGQ